MRSSCALVTFATVLFTSSGLYAQGHETHHRAPDGSHAKTESEGSGAPEIIPHRMRANGAAPTVGSPGAVTPPIEYHDGPVMITPNVYLIWYGNWSQENGTDTPAGQQIIRDFLFGLRKSPYYLTNTTYYDSNGPVSGDFVVQDEFADYYSRGNKISDSDVRAIVTTAIGQQTPDPNGIYFVLTSSDVAERSGFAPSTAAGTRTVQSLVPISSTHLWETLAAV